MNDEGEDEAKTNYKSKPWCGMTHITGWHCSRKVGHSGQHVAWGESTFPPTGQATVQARWDQDPPAATTRDQIVESLATIVTSLANIEYYLKESNKDVSSMALHTARQTMLLEKILGPPWQKS